MPDDLGRLDATAQADLVRRGEVSPLQLVDAAIARIEAVDPRLNAVIIPQLERARATARAAELLRGPFRGVPFLLKDLLCYTAGDPYHMGTRPLRDAGFLAPHDTWLAGRFREAGFVVLGRTNTPELGTLPTTEPDAYGPTRNPWDGGRSPGGSSGGSAAAVASGMVSAAHGNDGGGSIRIPASACGLVGLKPSRGRISFGPDLGEGVAGLAAEGVLTRSVRDTAAILDAVAGTMPGDPYTAPPFARPLATEVGTPPGRLRIGFTPAPFGGLFQAHPDAATAAERAARLLESLGHTVEPGHPPALDEIETGQHFTTFYAVNAARMLELVGGLVGRSLEAADVDPLNWALAEMGRVMSAGQYLTTRVWADAWTRRVASWWADGFDVLLTPTLPEPPPPLGTFAPSASDPVSVGIRASQFAAFTLPFNMTGQPAISLPLHWSDDGLPIGVQLVGAYGREDLLVRIAAQLEAAAPWSKRRPPVHA
ncbi:MAG TPA: amidase [Candidatus Binatia bacterium]|nr:amidase [Candidatus Binatia bacterium]